MSRPPITPSLDGVLLRLAGSDDDGDLIRMAELDSARPLAGPVLVAEANGAIVAALCLSTERAIADPFVPSTHPLELLRHHASSRQAPTTASSHGHRLLPRLAFRGAER